MKAVIFDIDGTLITSNYIDSKLYKEAIRDYFPAIKFKKDWSKYENITDEGILREILQDNDGESSVAIRNKIKSNFFDKISNYINNDSGFRSLPGAKNLISRLKKNKKYRIAFATGGWKKSAIMKLKSSGFALDDIPVFTSDDSVIKTEIMLKALKSLGNAIEEVTYFGDATWDRNAAEKLGWNFIAVGKRLKGIEDYSLIDMN